MPHVYVSIQALSHDVFKYAGYVPLLNAEDYCKAYEEHGPTGLPGDHLVTEPCSVLMLESYIAGRITGMGKPYGQQTYQPKQLIMTKRDGEKVLRMMWARNSRQLDENFGQKWALENGWMMHAFRPGDNGVWDKAKEQHEEIEAHDGKRT